MSDEIRQFSLGPYDADAVMYKIAALEDKIARKDARIRYLENLFDAREELLNEYKDRGGGVQTCGSVTEARARMLRIRLLSPDPPTTWSGIIGMSTPEVIHFFKYEIKEEAFRFSSYAKNPKRDAKIVMRYLAENWTEFKVKLVGHNKKVLYVMFNPDY